MSTAPDKPRPSQISFAWGEIIFSFLRFVFNVTVNTLPNAGLRTGKQVYLGLTLSTPPRNSTVIQESAIHESRDKQTVVVVKCMLLESRLASLSSCASASTWVCDLETRKAGGRTLFASLLLRSSSPSHSAAGMACAVSSAVAPPVVAGGALAQAKGSVSSRTGAVSVRLSKSFSGLHSIDLPSSSSATASFSVRADGAVKSSRLDSQKNLVLSVVASAGEKKNILMLGGTRFIGLFLARLLVKEGHEVTLFTRGKAAVTAQLPGETDDEYAAYSSQVKHIKGDRQDFDSLKDVIGGKGFNVVYDINGREGTEAEAILNAVGDLDQYIFCSSAGVYLKSDLLPHREIDAGDPKSRHKGKLDTEALLESKGVRWTSIRPVYIYGPLNYNPVEEWFFHRLKAGRPLPVPSSGLQVTQLGHVKDLAVAFVKCLGNEKAIRQVYNISGSRYVTFDGIARACAKAGGFPEPELIHYNPKEFDFGKKKAFPLRDQHFFTSIEKAQVELGWEPEFGLVEGLTDSYNLDFGRNTFRKAADFSTDDMILEKLGKKTFVAA